ncbi:MAG: hypothetical protein KAI66_01450 [Lentisphaeria bacterium]|nr:hypothetical protein [Lentisphaeria bacterium]
MERPLAFVCSCCLLLICLTSCRRPTDTATADARKSPVMVSPASDSIPADKFSTGGNQQVYIQQNFDSEEWFKPGRIETIGQPNTVLSGWTRQDDAAFEIVRSPVRSPPHALRISRVDSLRRMLFRRKTSVPAGHNFSVQFWCYAGAGGKVALFLFPDEQGREAAVAGVSTYGSGIGRMRLYDPTLKGRDKWVLTGQKTPLDTWFCCRLRFDVFQKLYWLTISTDKDGNTESDAFPFVAQGPVKALQFLNMPPAGNFVTIDDIEVRYEKGFASTVSNRRNCALGATLSDKSLTPINDQDPETGITLDSEQAEFRMELKTDAPASMIRIHSGRPDGSGKLGACRIRGLNASGQFPELVSLKASKRTAANDAVYAEYAFHPEVLNSLDIAVYAEPGSKDLFLREIEIYSPPILPGSVLRAKFAEKVHGEFRLPVYEDQKVACLHLFNTRKDKMPHKIGLTLTERFSGTVIKPLRQIELKLGENRIEFQLDALQNGSYIATVEDRAGGGSTGRKATFRRLLRLQHSVSFERQESYELAGKTMFFPDDHYLASVRDLEFRSCQGRAIEVVKPTLKSADFTQLGLRVYFDENGRLNVLCHRLNRGWMREKKRRYFLATATSEKLDDWTVKPLGKVPTIPSQGDAVWDETPPAAKPDWRAKRIGAEPIVLRFHDPARDGEVKLNQVGMRRITRGAEGSVMRRIDLDWSAIKPQRGSTWPIWFKAPGVGLVLTRESLLQDMPILIDELEDPKATNDNWAGQYLSDDGKTIFYMHASVLRRFPPFNAPWDNLARCSRILTVHRTSDGINYQRSHMALPDETDPPASQHYGGRIRRALGGNGLKIAHVARYKAYTQQIDEVVAYSWDWMHWRRCADRGVLAANGPHGSWSAGHIWLGGSAVQREGKVYHLIHRVAGVYHFQSEIVNGGTDETIKRVTGAWMEDRFQPRELERCPLFEKFGSWDKLAAHTRNTGVGVGVLVYRKDGLFCLEAKQQEGEFLTLPITAAGSLHVNALIGEDGLVQIELTDADGKALPAYSASNAILLKVGDHMDREVSFGGGKQLPQGKFRIRTRMRNAKLFTLSFSGR